MWKHLNFLFKELLTGYFVALTIFSCPFYVKLWVWWQLSTELLIKMLHGAKKYLTFFLLFGFHRTYISLKPIVSLPGCLLCMNSKYRPLCCVLLNLQLKVPVTVFTVLKPIWPLSNSTWNDFRDTKDLRLGSVLSACPLTYWVYWVLRNLQGCA